MKGRHTFFTALFILVSWGALAQTGTIKGTVKTSDGLSTEFVNVALKGTLKGDITDKDGNYEITNIPEGKYVLTCSYIGLTTKERNISINANETLVVDFQLSKSAIQLSEVTVRDKRKNKFYEDSSFTISKLPLKDLENPQVYNSVTREVLNEQVVTNFNDALKNATGITRLWESTGRGGDGAEFFSMRGFSVQPTMVNGMPSVNNGGLDPANVESIDVIKGPSGTLFGSPMISYGGLINVTTKKPYEAFGGSVNFINGSNGLNRLTADVNVPLSETTFTRVNAAYHSQNSFQDAGFSKSFFVAPSFKIKSSERLTFHINTELRSSESANAPMIFLNRNAPLSFNSIDIFEKNYTNSFTSNELSIQNPSFGLQAQAFYKLNEKWTSQTVLSRSNTKTNGYYHYLWDATDGDNFTRFISKRNGETNTTDIQQNFIGDFRIGGFRNRMIIGLDYFKSNILNGSTGWIGNGTVSLSTGEDTGLLTRAGVNSLLADSFEGNSSGENEVMSAYVSDVINFTPSLSAMASVRVDRFSSKSSGDDVISGQTAVSPKFGLVYQPIKEKVSIFANYMNGFVNIAPTEVSDVDGSNPRLKTFDPENANQYEAGVKTNIFNNRISATASYYYITVKDRVMTDPNNINNSIQGGEVESKGIELSLIANPVNGLNLIAGYSNNQSEVTKDNPEGGYLGLRPEEAGPESLINFWANYTIQSGVLQGLGFGFGGNSASEHKTLNRATTGTFTLPAYDIFNAALSYKANQYSIILKANNLTNQKYYTGWSTVTPQNLRNISVSLNYKF
ncbi:TonB-dependent receptor [Marivirga sp. S37H4]|uniref:TonB-dependent receptor n=1 Tax=Marivirga aurantiaca TaxID=2802615 RepID=A0A934WZT3_9BACT|nr:TonB-dependent receptor [Marivirga aurantiaca]MBK6266044.1 TonB-dependent receptor [Marivirga aurantiaca]